MSTHKLLRRAGMLVVPALLLSIFAAAQVPERPSPAPATWMFSPSGRAPAVAAAGVMDRRVSRFTVIESDLSYARISLDVRDLSDRIPVPRGEKVAMATWAFGLNVGYPFGAAFGYSGIVAAVVGSRDQSGSDDFFRTRFALPIGVKYDPSRAATTRGEVRLRLEELRANGGGMRPELRLGGGLKF